jgi:hypothetical protein
MWYIARCRKVKHKYEVKFVPEREFTTSDFCRLYISTALEHLEKEWKCKFIPVWINHHPVETDIMRDL